jgi:hypothetical protein
VYLRSRLMLRRLLRDELVLEQPLPLLSQRLVRGVLNRFLNSLVYGFDTGFVLLEDLDELLHDVEAIGVLDQTLHHLDVTETLREALHCFEV